MASLKQLRYEMLSTNARVLALNETVNSKQPLTESERSELTRLRTRAAEIRAQLDEAELGNERERAEAAGLGSGLDADARTSDLARRAAGLTAHRGAGALSDALGRPASDRTFAGMFGASALSLDGWDSGPRSAGQEFCRCIALGLNDGRLMAAAMSGSEGGGYAIPPGVFGPWLDTALESEIVRPRAQNWPILQGRERTIPAWDLTDRSSGLAGFVINWSPENPSTDATPQVGVTRQLKLVARRGSIFASTSGELLEDGYDFDAQLSAIMSQSLGYGLDASFLFGTGANEPLGVFNAPALISVTRATTNLINYVDLVNMFARMSPASIPNSAWVAHSSTIPQLAMLSFAIGTAGAHVPVMTQTDGRFYILTRPVIFSEKVLPLGSLGDIGLFDFSRYAIGLRRDASLEKSIHVGFLKNQQYFRLQIRVDGMPVDNAPTQPPNSAPTQSAFVALAA
ncbi:MAG: phage major capsid protein [Acidobacteria bacterium]|nr:phage major capsid protein [Acidobacteriota bacterium]